MGSGESCLTDQLYYAVNSHLKDEEKDLTGKITGMLLEADCHMIQHLLDDTSLLHRAIQTAKTTLVNSSDQHGGHTVKKSDSNGASSVHQNVDDDDDDDDDDDEGMGQLLFDRISVMYPSKVSKLTGMLLEMNRASLREMLKSEILFKAAIDKAYRVLTAVNEHPGESNSLDDNIESIGETLFLRIEALYPERASKITGMLLELDLETLNRLLNDDTLLKEAASKASDTIKNTSDPP